MAERPGGVYARLDARAYTRKSETSPEKSYVKGAPRPRIQIFELGNPKGNFNIELTLVSEEQIQITHRALEAARVAAGKALGAIGTAFYLKVYTYPHHVLRENPIATGAGADRFQEGMSRAFGKPIGTAARISKGKK